MTKSIVALSIDDVSSYSWLARRCIESLRRSGTRLDVVVFVSSGAGLDVGDLPNVELIDVGADQHESVYLQKWFRLARLETERVVYLDADTIGLQPLELLLERYQVADIYARQEAGTQRPHEANVNSECRAQVDWDAYDGQLTFARELPVVNTGVMVLNHWSCQTMKQCLADMCEIYNGWASGTIPYPCTNTHIMEELAVSAVLGRSGGPTLGLLSREDAPFYAELAAGAPRRGIVLHVWNGFYRTYLSEGAAGNDVSEYDFQQRRDALQRIQSARPRRPDNVLTRP